MTNIWNAFISDVTETTLTALRLYLQPLESGGLLKFHNISVQAETQHKDPKHFNVVINTIVFTIAGCLF